MHGGELLPGDPNDQDYVPHEREDPDADDADFDASVDDWEEIRHVRAAERACVEARLHELRRAVQDLERRLASLQEASAARR